MKKWRHTAFNILCISLVLCLSGCSTASRVQRDDGRLNVVSTVFAEYDFLRNIAGDAIHLTMLLTPGADLHTFEPTPKDMASVQNADLFVTIGGESDAWAEKIIRSVDSDSLHTIRLMDMVDIVEEETVEGMQGEEEPSEAHDSHAEENEEKKEFDEHVWTSPKNAIQIVNGLKDTLCDLDSTNKETYQKNAASYIKKLQKLDEKFEEITKNAKRHTIIVGDRFPFRYFADAYNLEYYAAFPGCSTETGASAETIAFLIDKVKEEQIPVVFHVELSSEMISNTICDETGAKKKQLNAVHNISRTDFTAGKGYLELMEENLPVLKEALN